MTNRENVLEMLSTEGCLLCEQALDVLFSMPELGGMTLSVRDIALDEDLVARYGERLPVLRARGAELAWPFDAPGVLRWLSDLSPVSRETE